MMKCIATLFACTSILAATQHADALITTTPVQASICRVTTTAASYSNPTTQGFVNYSITIQLTNTSRMPITAVNIQSLDQTAPLSERAQMLINPTQSITLAYVRTGIIKSAQPRALPCRITQVQFVDGSTWSAVANQRSASITQSRRSLIPSYAHADNGSNETQAMTPYAPPQGYAQVQASIALGTQRQVQYNQVQNLNNFSGNNSSGQNSYNGNGQNQTPYTGNNQTPGPNTGNGQGQNIYPGRHHHYQNNGGQPTANVGQVTQPNYNQVAPRNYSQIAPQNRNQAQRSYSQAPERNYSQATQRNNDQGSDASAKRQSGGQSRRH